MTSVEEKQDEFAFLKSESEDGLLLFAVEKTLNAAPWLECIQEIECIEYQQEALIRLKQLFEANTDQVKELKKL